MDPNNIKEMTVLKGDKATNIYGAKGKNGVIEIITKDRGPWVSNSKVSAIGFYKTDDKSSLEFIIDKNTKDGRLEILEREFKLKNMDLKFSKVRRNKKGEITSIKISLDDNDGKKSSATFKEKDNTIPNILIGKNDDKLLIRSIN